jgi:hypothetical protein
MIGPEICTRKAVTLFDIRSICGKLIRETNLQRRGELMPITNDAFEYLIARAGLTLSDAEKAELKSVCDGIAAMAERVRKPRGRMAEPALTYGFAEEDL